MKTMISVEDALNTINSSVKPLPSETVSIGEALGRVCSQDIHAAITHPPFNASAMDGYAVKLNDVDTVGNTLTVIGESRAGEPCPVALTQGHAIRIFTGGVVPEGADHVVIQENVTRHNDEIRVETAQEIARNIRRAGVDFQTGDLLIKAGTAISPFHATLLAGANIAQIEVSQKPIIAYFDNGDELMEPGSVLKPGQIIGSNRFAIDGLIRQWGGQPRYLGRAIDSQAEVEAKFRSGADEAHIIVPIGGASVGDHDYVRAAFEGAGGNIIFQKIAVKPGKPTWFGKVENSHVLGLPGNPASALVCAILFLRPLIKGLLGDEAPAGNLMAKLTTDLRANGARETYMRASVKLDSNGVAHVTPESLQDSALMSRMARSNVLLNRPAFADTKKAGELVPCLIYNDLD